MNLANAKVKNYVSRFGNSLMAKQCILNSFSISIINVWFIFDVFRYFKILVHIHVHTDISHTRRPRHNDTPNAKRNDFMVPTVSLYSPYKSFCSVLLFAHCISDSRSKRKYNRLYHDTIKTNTLFAKFRPRDLHWWGAVLLFIQHFLISRIRFLDIKKCFYIKNFISWYQELYFLISWNNKYYLISRILDIKKYI